MDIAHILEELAYDMGELPREAIEAAIAQRRQITPFLLQILQDALLRMDEIVEDDNYQAHLYALYLLAQFKEARAFPLLLELLSHPGEALHAILGDVLTEDLGRILASVCNNNIEPLKKLIENGTIDEYVRAACIDALIILVGAQEQPREAIIGYFKALLEHRLERSPSFVWDQLALGAALLHPNELYPALCEAYQEKLITPSFIRLEEITTLLNTSKESLLLQLQHNTEFIEDAVSEMEKWNCTHSFQ
jgi:hypothetical protein